MLQSKQTLFRQNTQYLAKSFKLFQLFHIVSLCNYRLQYILLGFVVKNQNQVVDNCEEVGK